MFIVLYSNVVALQRSAMRSRDMSLLRSEQRVVVGRL
jgi:hypothetical protein